MARTMPNCWRGNKRKNLNLREMSWVWFFRVELNISKRFHQRWFSLNLFKNLIFSFSENKCWAVKLCITLSRSCYCWHCLSILFMAFPKWSNLSPHGKVVYRLIFTLPDRHEARGFLPCHFQEIAFELQQMLQVVGGVHCGVYFRIRLCLWNYEIWLMAICNNVNECNWLINLFIKRLQ